ncbi:hypothetical protein PX52LOC_01104 [Limnoglobus roseus]|uniref:Lipoprotein n=2 Tax=Limnoglobus roseus TaxID=2598579 RepID=A0A5C1AAT4_9BACT|nr:hypothetical protein PX52LOC_01104 [Limnoglobus roseus]
MKRLIALMVLTLAVGCSGEKAKPTVDAETAKKEQEQMNKMMKDTGEQRPGTPPK